MGEACPFGPDWDRAVRKFGEAKAMELYKKNGNQIPQVGTSTGIIINGLELTSNERKDLFNSVDVLFLKKIFEGDPYNFFDKKIDISPIYGEIKEEVLESLKNEINRTNNTRLAQVREALKNDFIAVINEHQQKISGSYGITIDFDDLVENQKDEVDKESRSSLDVRASIEFNTKDHMPKAIKMFIGLLYKRNKKGEIVKNSLGLNSQEDWTTVTNLLVNNLAGLTSIDQMINKVRQLSLEHPSLIPIPDMLGGTSLVFSDIGFDQTDIEDYYNYKIRNEFVQAFAKTKYTFLLQVIKDDGEIQVIDANSDQIKDRIRQEWKSNLELQASKNAKDIFIAKLKRASYSEMLELLGIDSMNSKDLLERSLPLKGKDKAVTDILADLRPEIIKFLDKENIQDIYSRNTPFTGTMDILAEAESSYRDIVELQFRNAEGKSVYGVSLNTYQTLLMDSINNIIDSTESGEKREEVLKKEMPFLFNVYTKNSKWLNKIINGRSRLVNNLFDGSKYEDGEHISQLKETDLYSVTLNAVLRGYYMSLKHADRSMYPTYNFDDKELIIKGKTREEAIANALPIFKGYLEDLVARTKNSMQTGVQNTYQNYSENSKGSNIYANMLPTEDLIDIASGKRSLDENDMERVERYLEKTIDEHIKDMEDWQVLTRYNNRQAVGLSNSISMNKNDAVAVAVLNAIAGHIEETKLFTGDPAFYSSASDFFKRLNTQSSTGELMIVDNENNSWVEANNKIDKFTIDGIEYTYSKPTDGTITELVVSGALTDRNGKQVPVDKIFISKIIDQITQVFIADARAAEPGKSESYYKEKMKDYINAYTKYEEADGFSFANIFFIREMMHRSGAYNAKIHETFKHELSLIGKSSAIGSYVLPTNVPIRDAANWFNDNFQGFVQEKLQYVGPNYGLPKDQYGTMAPEDRVNATSIRKTSYYTLVPSSIMGTELQLVMEFMLKNNIDVLHLLSAAKVGAKEIRPFYKYDENGTTGVNVDEITEDQKGYLDFRYLKKQVKIAAKEKKNITSSTQSRVILLEGLMVDGIPKDFKGDWNSLDEKQKLEASPIYKLIKDYQATQTRLIEIGIQQLLAEFDAQETEENKFEIRNFKKFTEVVWRDAKDKGTPDNILQALEEWSENKSFIEILPNPDKIQNLINSLITNRVLVQKRPGEGLPQTSVLGMETIGTKRNYKEYNGAKYVEASDALNFYSFEFDKQGNVTKVNPAEIIMPLPVSWLPKIMRMTGKRDIVEAINEFNGMIADPEMNIETSITVKALRIPNQQLSSNDIFKVKKFTPPFMQQSVIVPSELVAKTGGDFDIDKVQIYFRNTDQHFKPIPYLETFTTEDNRKAYNKYLLNILSVDETLKILKKYIPNIKQELDVLKVQQALGSMEDEDITSEKELVKILIQEKQDFIDNLYLNITDFKKASDSILTFEEFSLKPSIFKNSEESLQNKLLELEEQLILNPSQAKNLLTPVTEGTLKKLAEELVDVADRKLAWPSAILMATQIKAALDFVGGKAGVGQVATWITFLPKAQINNLSVNEFFNGNEGPIPTKFWFEGLEENYSLAGTETALSSKKAKEYIMEGLSQILTSQVDNVKDPYAVALQIVNQTLNPLCYMFLRGVPMETAVRFLNQPIIKTYLREQRISESQIAGSTGRKGKNNPNGLALSKDKLREKVVSEYPGSLDNRFNTPITNEELIEGSSKKGNPSNDSQLWILDHFINIQAQAVEIAKVKNYLSPDTKYLKSKSDAKQVLVNLKNEIERADIISDVEIARSENNLLSGFFKGRDLYYYLFKDLFFTEQEGIEKPFEYWKDKALLEQRGTESKDKIAALYEQEFINFIIQRFSEKTVGDKTRPLFKNKFTKLFTGDTSLAKRLMKIQKTEDNLFLNELLGLINNTQDGDTLVDNIKSYRNKMLVAEANTMIQSMEEFMDKYPEYEEDLMVFNIFQAGIKPGPYQLNKLFSYASQKMFIDFVTNFDTSDINWSAQVRDFHAALMTAFPKLAPTKYRADMMELPYYRQKVDGKWRIIWNGVTLPIAGEGYKFINYADFQGPRSFYVTEDINPVDSDIEVDLGDKETYNKSQAEETKSASDTQTDNKQEFSKMKVSLDTVNDNLTPEQSEVFAKFDILFPEKSYLSEQEKLDIVKMMSKGQLEAYCKI